MTSNELHDRDHVVRYARPQHIKNGRVRGPAFCLRPRPDETGLSVNWLECFGGLSKNEQLGRVRKLSRLEMRRNGCLAELNVGKTRQRLHEIASLRFIHTPLESEGDYEADPSHSDIEGLPPGNSDQGVLVGDMIAYCIKNIHPAVT